MKEWTKSFAQDYTTPSMKHAHILRPTIKKLVGNVEGKNIVDLSCGSGYFSRILAKRGANVVGIDISENQIKLAMQNKVNEIKYIRDNITNTKLKSNYFDIALINLVFIDTNSTKKISQILKEAHRILRKNGILIIGELHPHSINKKSKTGTYRQISRKNYFDNGSVCNSTAILVNGKKLTFYPDYHYTLEFYINTIIENGFAITKLLEPEWKEDFPSCIVIAAKKV